MSRKLKWFVGGAIVLTHGVLWLLHQFETEIRWCKGLRLHGAPHDAVALASYPGSGNTWLRYLLQQATGIMTGSCYSDEFLGDVVPGKVMDGRVLVVKTHFMPSAYVNRCFKSAVLLIRNPKDAVLAEFHRTFVGDTGTLPKSAFSGAYAIGKFWETFVPEFIMQWWKFHTMWLLEYPGPVHVVLYTNLVRDTRSQLRKILRFLDHPVTENDLDCAIIHGNGFARRKKLKNFDPFTPEMYALLNEAVKNVSDIILLRQLAAGESADNRTQWWLHGFM